MIDWVLLFKLQGPCNYLVTIPNSPRSSLTLIRKLCSKIMPNGLNGDNSSLTFTTKTIGVVSVWCRGGGQFRDGSGWFQVLVRAALGQLRGGSGAVPEMLQTYPERTQGESRTVLERPRKGF